VIKILTWMI